MPYWQSYSYNALGNLTGRDSTLWDYAGSWNFSNTIENNRVTTGAFYDNDGRRTYGDGVYFKYDAAGAMHETTRTANYETKLYHDGLGRETKRSQRTWDAEEEEYGEWDSKYLIHSSVFGRIITEAEKTGRKWRTFVMANGSSIARQSKTESGSASLVTFEYREASGLSAGNVVSPTSDFAHAYLREELDGLGNNVGHVAVENPLDEARNSQSPVDRIAIEGIDMGFCNRGGLFGPCDMVSNLDNLSSNNDNRTSEMFESLFVLGVGYGRQKWIDLFSYGNMLPIQIDRPRGPTRNSPQAIAHEIMQSLGFDPLYIAFKENNPGGPIDEGFDHNATGPNVIIYPNADTKPQGIPNCIKAYLVGKWKLDKEAVNKATFTRSQSVDLKFTVYGTYLADGTYTYNTGQGAMTWGTVINFQENAFDPSNGIDALEVALAGHEVFHVQQYVRDSNFLKKYIANYVANLADAGVFKSLASLWAAGTAGIHDEAYRNINYEEEAYEFQRKILKDIEENGNPCNPVSKNGRIYNP